MALKVTTGYYRPLLVVYGTPIVGRVSCFQQPEIDHGTMTLIRILILAANPRNTDRLRLDEEVREIQAALEESRNRDEFEVITRWAVRVDDLQKVLLDHNPQIVHFSGHGDGDNGLILEDELGHACMVSTKALAKLFSFFQNTIQCVCLNACYSEVQAEAIHASIPFVVGMNQSIGDKAAIKFSKGFYRAIGANRLIEEAYEFGCNAIDLQHHPDVSVPVIKRKLEVVSSTSKPAVPATSSPAVLKTSLTPMTSPNQNRSVSIGGSVTGSAIVTGDGNTVSVQFQPAALPQPESVNIQAELDALHELLSQLQSPDQRKIDNALDDAKEELKKPKPDKDEVGQALDRAMTYAQKANGFAEAIDKLRPHVEKAASWLGENWYKLLTLVGLTF
jgi:hypothetical protein